MEPGSSRDGTVDESRGVQMPLNIEHGEDVKVEFSHVEDGGRHVYDVTVGEWKWTVAADYPEGSQDMDIVVLKTYGRDVDVTVARLPNRKGARDNDDMIIQAVVEVLLFNNRRILFAGAKEREEGAE